MNLYAYVGNDPLNRIDPTGLAQCGDLEGSECESTLDDAQAARDKANKIGEALGETADKIDEEGVDSLSDHESSIVDAVNERFGDSFQGASGLRNLSRGGRKLHLELDLVEAASY